MENYRFDYHHHLNPYASGFPFHNGYPNTVPVYRNPLTIEDFLSRNLPPFPVSPLQQLKASEPNNSANRIHIKPHFHHSSPPLPNSQPAQKKFLVFDRSGDKTTLLYCSGATGPFQFGAYRGPNPPPTRNLKEQSDTNNLLRTDENIEDHSREMTQGENHEDTEEIDALLCSDYDSEFSEDDEVSTGHSPSTMTDNGLPNRVEEETGEEVDSVSVRTRKRKLSALESDAESSCGNGKENSNSLSVSKRLRREKIYETVSILQSVVPNANGKDAIVVIDEAIHYLKSLKAEAKALGLDAF